MTENDYLSQFNLYDLLASFLPGAFLLLSIVIPYTGSEIILTELTIGGALVFIVFSYTFGLMTQALGGSIHSGEDAFVERLQVITEGIDSEKEPSDVKPVEIKFVESVRREFDLDANYDDWESVYRLILSKLETTARTRTIRLQALFLAMRGFAVIGIVLVLSYLVMIGLNVTGTVETAASVHTLIVLLPFGVLLSIIAWSRSSEFSEDVIAYMVLEYTLERNE